MLSNDPYAVIVRNELEQRRRRAARARLVREAELGRIPAGAQPARSHHWMGRLRQGAVRILGLTPSAGAA